MGLIKAALGAAGGTFADQWKEYFVCDALDADTLVACGYKKTSGRSSNTKGSTNIITDGSIITVAKGQCMMIVAQGKVVELSAEEGAFTYNNKTEPSFFGGGILDGIKSMFGTFTDRMAFGGEAVGDQRVYYFNTKEIMGNKYGTKNPIPFRLIDNNIGLDIDVSIRCSGEYSYRICNPMLFYSNVCGNVGDDYTRDNIDSTLKAELVNALQPALAKLSVQGGIRYSSLPAYTTEITNALNEVLSKQWSEKRGLEVVSFNMNPPSISKEDEDMIQNLQRTAVMRNPGMAGATLVDAQAQAMKDAANNSGGSFVGFAGMNMAQGAGGMNAQNFFNMQQQQQMQMQQQQMQQQQMQQQQMQQPQQPAGGWACECGSNNQGKFCMNCGKPKPESNSWKCGCGTDNQGKFCMNCGKPKAGFKCDKCGWKPEGDSMPKFCPECGDVFDENDRG